MLQRISDLEMRLKTKERGYADMEIFYLMQIDSLRKDVRGGFE